MYIHIYIYYTSTTPPPKKKWSLSTDILSDEYADFLCSIYIYIYPGTVIIWHLSGILSRIYRDILSDMFFVYAFYMIEHDILSNLSSYMYVYSEIVSDIVPRILFNTYILTSWHKPWLEGIQSDSK